MLASLATNHLAYLLLGLNNELGKCTRLDFPTRTLAHVLQVFIVMDLALWVENALTVEPFSVSERLLSVLVVFLEKLLAKLHHQRKQVNKFRVERIFIFALLSQVIVKEQQLQGVGQRVRLASNVLLLLG